MLKVGFVYSPSILHILFSVLLFLHRVAGILGRGYPEHVLDTQPIVRHNLTLLYTLNKKNAN